MALHSTLRKSLPPLLAALILVAFTVTGLAAGVGVRRLVDGGTANSPVRQGTFAAQTPVSQSSPTPSATASPTVLVAPGGQATRFSLNVSVSPATVAGGQQFTVTATVIARDNVTLLSGVPCTMGPGAGPAPFGPGQWPPTKLSGDRGTVTWRLTAPFLAPGSYTIRVTGAVSNGYFAYFDFPLRITA